MFEAANYGIFLGDTERARRIAERLRVWETIVSECGHAYTVSRWEAPKRYQDHPFTFRVRSILEVVVEYIREGPTPVYRSRNRERSCGGGRLVASCDKHR